MDIKGDLNVVDLTATGALDVSGTADISGVEIDSEGRIGINDDGQATYGELVVRSKSSNTSVLTLVAGSANGLPGNYGYRTEFRSNYSAANKFNIFVNNTGRLMGVGNIDPSLTSSQLYMSGYYGVALTSSGGDSTPNASQTGLLMTGSRDVGIGTIAPSAHFHVVNDTASDVATIIEGAVSQTGNLLEINSNGGSGGNLLEVASSGNLTTTGLFTVTNTDYVKARFIRTSSTSSTVFECTNDAGSTQFGGGGGYFFASDGSSHLLGATDSYLTVTSGSKIGFTNSSTFTNSTPDTYLERASSNTLSTPGTIEAARFNKSVYGNGNASGTLNVDVSTDGTVHLTATGNVTLNLNNSIDGQELIIRFRQDGTGGRTLSITDANFGEHISDLSGISSTASSVSYIGLRRDNSNWDVLSVHGGF